MVPTFEAVLCLYGLCSWAACQGAAQQCTALVEQDKLQAAARPPLDRMCYMHWWCHTRTQDLKDNYVSASHVRLTCKAVSMVTT